MNDNLNIFERILQRFSFREPVPGEARGFALYYKRKALELTFKHFGEYNVFYGMAMRAYFAAKRAGINLTISQVKIILLLGSFFAGAALAGAIYFYNYTGTAAETDGGRDVATIIPQTFPVADPQKIIKPETLSEKLRYRIAVEQFSGEAIDRIILNKITDKVADRLSVTAGKQSVINLRKGRREKNYNRLLSGSVERLGNTYMITARIIDIESSKVLFVTTEETDDAAEIDTVCEIISRKVQANLRSQ